MPNNQQPQVITPFEYARTEGNLQINPVNVDIKSKGANVFEGLQNLVGSYQKVQQQETQIATTREAKDAIDLKQKADQKEYEFKLQLNDEKNIISSSTAKLASTLVDNVSKANSIEDIRKAEDAYTKEMDTISGSYKNKDLISSIETTKWNTVKQLQQEKFHFIQKEKIATAETNISNILTNMAASKEYDKQENIDNLKSNFITMGHSPGEATQKTFAIIAATKTGNELKRIEASNLSETEKIAAYKLLNTEIDNLASKIDKTNMLYGQSDYSNIKGRIDNVLQHESRLFIDKVYDASVDKILDSGNNLKVVDKEIKNLQTIYKNSGLDSGLWQDKINAIEGKRLELIERAKREAEFAQELNRVKQVANDPNSLRNWENLSSKEKQAFINLNSSKVAQAFMTNPNEKTFNDFLNFVSTTGKGTSHASDMIGQLLMIAHNNPKDAGQVANLLGLSVNYMKTSPKLMNEIKTNNSSLYNIINTPYIKGTDLIKMYETNSLDTANKIKLQADSSHLSASTWYKKNQKKVDKTLIPGANILGFMSYKSNLPPEKVAANIQTNTYDFKPGGAKISTPLIEQLDKSTAGKMQWVMQQAYKNPKYKTYLDNPNVTAVFLEDDVRFYLGDTLLNGGLHYAVGKDNKQTNFHHWSIQK